ncbi:hypothetical protein FHL15_005630 [Xylaria flabelliformis]|uniref:Uncharacterized protein n=1 Tax=Xylaria flabelliformis TaxID=2512241 RepID=A0A553HZK0_9PEZI|nr:hypothetical protein FHL15_005630 [Xylaria flabelliformis]
MHFITFILGALTAPQLSSARPPTLVSYPALHHQLSQATTTGTHNPNSLRRLGKRDDMKATMTPYKCAGHGAQCVKFPPDAPSNETIWVRMYCHHFRHHRPHHHHHHHHHNNKPEDDPKRRNGTSEFPVMMYPCPKDTWCRVNNLPEGYYPPPWLDDWEPNPDPDPVSDIPNPDDDRGEMSWANVEEVVREHAGSVAVASPDADSGEEEGIQKYVQPLPWWDIAFTCVHKDDDDQYGTR